MGKKRSPFEEGNIYTFMLQKLENHNNSSSWKKFTDTGLNMTLVIGNGNEWEPAIPVDLQ